MKVTEQNLNSLVGKRCIVFLDGNFKRVADVFWHCSLGLSVTSCEEEMLTSNDFCNKYGNEYDIFPASEIRMPETKGAPNQSSAILCPTKDEFDLITKHLGIEGEVFWEGRKEETALLYDEMIDSKGRQIRQPWRVISSKNNICKDAVSVEEYIAQDQKMPHGEHVVFEAKTDFYTRPPLGIMPKIHWENQCNRTRQSELYDCICRYLEAGMGINSECIEEYNELINKLK